ncbi:2149_t:CDS:2 [Ambispora gerdemannii]|uniref:2149_t:CDS:1 n=1 Tax=Ambispora gerdemannii TaxID=144530 RepID=A0A9N8VA02_9GLOM|nr:2149_t:CDS:2 [Ambispora gerdemannii]
MSKVPPETAIPENLHLNPPKNDTFTVEQLSEYNGETANKPVYVAIKGTIFDVSSKRDSYGPGGSYHIFAGKDASKALGTTSLKPEDAVADISTLNDEQLKVLDQWFDFFEKRYNIVGRVV